MKSSYHEILCLENNYASPVFITEFNNSAMIDTGASIAVWRGSMFKLLHTYSCSITDKKLYVSGVNESKYDNIKRRVFLIDFRIGKLVFHNLPIVNIPKDSSVDMLLPYRMFDGIELTFNSVNCVKFNILPDKNGVISYDRNALLYVVNGKLRTGIKECFVKDVNIIEMKVV